MDAKLAQRWVGKNLSAVILSPLRFRQLEQEVEDDWLLEDPRRVFGVEVKVRPGAIFDIETEEIQELEGVEWQT